jgi:hypothetical protein
MCQCENERSDHYHFSTFANYHIFTFANYFLQRYIVSVGDMR